LSIDTRIHLLSRCIQIRRLLENQEVAIVHHWDADGIASAALLGRVFGVDTFVIPRIGCYGIDCIGRAETPVLVDYGIPVNTVIKGAIDHHRSRQDSSICIDTPICNPVSAGLSEDEFPSTTYVIKSLILTDSEVSKNGDLIALGIVGDLGTRVLHSEHLRAFVVKALGSIERALKLANLVDSCYRAGSYECIDRVRKALIEGGVAQVEYDTSLQELSSDIDAEAKKVIERIEIIYSDDAVAIFRARSKYFLTSYIGRYLARVYAPKTIVLLHHVESLGLGMVYIRSYGIEVKEIIPILRALGYSAGGKDWVAAALCRDSFCRDIEKVIHVLLGGIREKALGSGTR